MLFSAVSVRAEAQDKVQDKAQAGAGPFSFGGKQTKSDSPLHISSDRMEAYQNEKLVIFEGNVVAQQDDITLTGHKMKVYSVASPNEKGAAAKTAPATKPKTAGKPGDAKTAGKPGDAATGGPKTGAGVQTASGGLGQSAMSDKVDRIEVEGNVRITQREKMATSDRAFYYHSEQKIVLIGNPKLYQGNDVVAGRLVTFYLDSGKCVVEGGSDTPVKTVLHPSKKD